MAATTCTSPVYKRQFFANTTFSGTPKRVDCDSVIDQTWGTGAPASGLPSNYFGVRWSVTRDFGSGGPFVFWASARDGIRVYLDGVRKIDIWRNVSTTQSRTAYVTIPSGRHSLRVDFVNWTGSANVKFSYAPRTSATVDKVRPLAPTLVTGYLEQSTAMAKVTWAANKEMNLAGYRVYRRPAGSSVWTLVKTTGSRWYGGVPPVAGQTYYFEVRAYDKAGNTSAGSADVGVKTYAMTTPTGFGARGADTGIQLTWNAVPGAVRYLVVNDADMDSPSEYATGTSMLFHPVQRSQLVRFRIAAVDGAGRQSALSPASYPPAAARRLVAAPQEPSVTAAPGSGTLRWKYRPGPDSPDGEYAGFHVYRSTTLPVSTATAPLPCATTEVPLSDGRREVTCTDDAVDAEGTYHYVVRGFDADGNESLSSGTVTLAKDVTPPAAVTGLTATATEYGVALKWNAVGDRDLARYVVHSGDLQGDTCVGGPVKELAPTTTSYDDVRLSDGEEKCYFVDTVDLMGNSNFASTGGAQKAVVTELDLMPTVATPEGSPVTVTTYHDDPWHVMTWDAVPGATAYRVYMWSRTTLSYRLVATEPEGYFSEALASGSTFFYRVTAVYADGSESLPAFVPVVTPPSE
ncbi:PA14 domain-containing protein [Streptomyces sp. NPDC051940]|uniref:PA14 domain-containing protein n=1 Tax=Streptomyces sp. NPDC051940 TaxID=3155675 RepID=UPI00342C7E50